MFILRQNNLFTYSRLMDELLHMKSKNFSLFGYNERKERSGSVRKSAKNNHVQHQTVSQLYHIDFRDSLELENTWMGTEQAHQLRPDVEAGLYLNMKLRK